MNVEFEKLVKLPVSGYALGADRYQITLYRRKRGGEAEAVVARKPERTR